MPGGTTIRMIPESSASQDAANVFTQNQTIKNAAPAILLIDTTGGAKSARIQVDANILTIDEVDVNGAFVAQRAKVDLVTGSIYNAAGQKMATELFAIAMAVAL